MKIENCREEGFASLVSILLIFVIAVFVTSLLVLSALTDERISRDTLNSMRSFATAESGLEDRMLRITSSKQYPSSGTLALNGGVATVLTGSSGNAKSVTSTADVASRIRRLVGSLYLSTQDVEFHYGVQIGDGGLVMENQSSVIGNVYSNGSISGLAGSEITGDVWVAGGTQPVPATEWTVQNGDAAFGAVAGSISTAVDSTGDVGAYASVALGSDDFARISYYDDSNNDLKFVRCTNADCTTKNITTVDSAGDVGWRYTAVALGSDGFARISYYTNTTNDLKFARCTNADCTGSIITTVDSSGDVGQFSSMVLDAGNLASIAYYDVSGGDLKFARCIDADCATQNIRTVDAANDVGKYTALTLGTDGVARISYLDETADDLKFARCNDNNCSSPVITTVDAAAEIEWRTSIAMGSDGFARISYYEDSPNEDLKFAQCTNADCTTKNIATVDSSGSVGKYNSVKLGGSDVARIAYYDASNGSVKFARCTNAACTASVISVPDTASDAGHFSSLAIASDGFARIAHYENSGGDLKFIRCTDADCMPSQNRFDVAQSFQTSTTAPINKVSLYIKKVGSPSNITIRIMEDESGDPGNSSGETLTSGMLNPGPVTASYGWVDVTFSSSPTLNASTTYWIVADGAQDNANYFVWGYDTGDGYAYGTGKWSADWSAGNPVWTSIGGDFDFKVWMGGVETEIDGVDVGGDAHAHRIENTSVSSSAFSVSFINSEADGDVFTDILQDCTAPILGNASYNTISNCTVNGVTTTPVTPPADPPPQNMPISQGQIDQWKTDAAAGGTINGDFAPDTSTSLGPKVINGNLILTTNNVTLTLRGTVYVKGYIDISNGSAVRLDSGYGSLSGLILADAWVHVQNNGVFGGSGQAGSYIMLLSTSSCRGVAGPSCAHHDAAIDLHNNASGAIFYASDGLIYLHNGVNATELTGYKMQLNQTAKITYEQGLANSQFSAGPGASWQIQSWREVE